MVLGHKVERRPGNGHGELLINRWLVSGPTAGKRGGKEEKRGEKVAPALRELRETIFSLRKRWDQGCRGPLQKGEVGRFGRPVFQKRFLFCRKISVLGEELCDLG